MSLVLRVTLPTINQEPTNYTLLQKYYSGCGNQITQSVLHLTHIFSQRLAGLSPLAQTNHFELTFKEFGILCKFHIIFSAHYAGKLLVNTPAYNIDLSGL